MDFFRSLVSTTGPWKASPREIHLPRLPSQDSARKSGQNVQVALLHGHSADRLYTKVRNQEKGLLAKGVSAESSVMALETKIPKDIGPSSTFGT